MYHTHSGAGAYPGSPADVWDTVGTSTETSATREGDQPNSRRRTLPLRVVAYGIYLSIYLSTYDTVRRSRRSAAGSTYVSAPRTHRHYARYYNIPHATPNPLPDKTHIVQPSTPAQRRLRSTSDARSEARRERDSASHTTSDARSEARRERDSASHYTQQGHATPQRRVRPLPWRRGRRARPAMARARTRSP